MADPVGTSLALTAGPLDADPDWTRIDDATGVTEQTIEVSRGRDSEADKVSAGTVTINGTDQFGALDPTNASGPYYLDLVPVMQAAQAIYDPIADEWGTIFRGHWADLDYTVDVSERYSTFELDLVDALDILADAEVIPGQAGNTDVPSESVGDTWYDGSTAKDRIYAAIADASTAAFGMVWPAGLLNLFDGNVYVQGSVYSGDNSSLDVIGDAQDAELPMAANFFASRQGILCFRGRDARFSPGAYAGALVPVNFWKLGDLAAFADDDTTVVINGLTFTLGKTNLITVATVYPTGIDDADIPGQTVAEPTAVAAFGVRAQRWENLLNDGNFLGDTSLVDCQDMAAYVINNYSIPTNRIKTITIKNPPAGASEARAAAIWAFARQVELGDVVTVTTTHPGGGGFAGVDFFVEHIAYELKPSRGDLCEMALTLEVSPRSLFDFDPWPRS